MDHGQGAKVDLDVKGGRGGRGSQKSVAQHAADMGDLQIFQLLMDDGAGGRQRMWSGARGNTPLHHAALYNRLNIVRWCVENGCDVNMPGEHGCTVLHIAARHGYGEMVAYLLDAGANPAAVSSDQKTPAMLSKDEEIKDLFDFFQKMKAGGPLPPAHVQASSVQSGGADKIMSSSMSGWGQGTGQNERPHAGMTYARLGGAADGITGGPPEAGSLFGRGDDEGVSGLGGSRASRRAGKEGLGGQGREATGGAGNLLSWGHDSTAVGGPEGRQSMRQGGRASGSSAGSDKPEWLGGGNGGVGGQKEEATLGGASRGRMKNSNTSKVRQ